MDKGGRSRTLMYTFFSLYSVPADFFADRFDADLREHGPCRLERSAARRRLTVTFDMSQRSGRGGSDTSGGEVLRRTRGTGAVFERLPPKTPTKPPGRTFPFAPLPRGRSSASSNTGVCLLRLRCRGIWFRARCGCRTSAAGEGASAGSDIALPARRVDSSRAGK